MTTDFSGTWKSRRSEGWPALLNKLNIPTGNLPPNLKMTHVITQNGNEINLKTTNNIDENMRETTIVVGENFVDPSSRILNVEYTTAWSAADGRLVMDRVTGDGGITREITNGGEMVVMITYGDTVAKTWSTRVD